MNFIAIWNVYATVAKKNFLMVAKSCRKKIVMQPNCIDHYGPLHYTNGP